ncbi:ROK family protein [Pontibacter silvestris]|uniref:ROK family protein n=1 Tax=Pontibacter silvestris TaxID=2305183 RepID=A0ABW4WSX1_9BACT|nr:ROK family protein [Pontibacter silvestris]MCC9138408.1 ROK family protein [Pontibacter silvestris]
MQQSQKIVGIDIGATKTHIGIVQEGDVISEIKLTTSAYAPKEQIVGEIISGIEQLFDTDTLGIGIGVPGLVDEKNGVVCGVQNIPSWKEVHLKKYLEEHFQKPVYITNDANSFVLGEKIYGKAKDLKNIVGITLGTGFGTGIIINNSLYSGTLSCAGEFGGVPYLDQTIEDYCSGKFFLNKCGMPGKKVQLLAKDGNQQALEVLHQFGYHLGNAIKVILYALSPEAIFLGGSVSKCYPFFEKTMRESIATFPFKLVTDQLIVEPSGIDKAAILGAAALFKMKSENNSKLQKTLL